MKKAGVIISILSGFIGILFSLMNAIAGHTVPVWSEAVKQSHVRSGWTGVLLSTAIIILGFIAYDSRTRIFGILIVATAAAGCVFSMMPTPLLMIASLAGGVLVIVGT